jgi:hypothetical protein
MTFRTLIPSYLESNHIDSLRHELCDIIYNDYKGTTFSLSGMLEEKTEVLNKVYKFIKEHPELSQYKEDSKYWYPYKNVDGSGNLSIYKEYYPNTDGEITYFLKKEERKSDMKNLFKGYDYLFDPVKIQFILMCIDIPKMDCEDKLAKEIIKINNELFKVLFDTVGDTINYDNKNTLEHMQRYFKSYFDEQEEIKNDPKYKDEFKEYLLNKSRMFTDNIELLDQAFIVANENKLQKELPVNPEPKTAKKKI